MTQRSNIVKLRLTDLEKQDWQTAAGGPRKLSDWVRSVCNQAANNERVSSEAVYVGETSSPEHPTSVPNVKPQIVADAVARGVQPKAQCARWMHHRPGVYCGSCKKVAGK